MNATNNNIPGKNILQAMHKIAFDIQFVEKTGNNTFNNYSYASELDLLMAVRPVMMDYGVICYPQNINVISPSGDNRTDAIVNYRFCHVESGEYIDVCVLSSGADKGDKGPFKLMTGALKYALRQAFLIAAGDDPEAFDPDSGKRTGPNRDSSHPMQKLIDVANNLGYDLVNDPLFQKAWAAIGVDITNLTTSGRDMKITMAIKELVKTLRDEKLQGDALKQAIASFANNAKQL